MRYPQFAASQFPGQGRVLQMGNVVKGRVVQTGAVVKKRKAPNPIGEIKKEQASVLNVLGKAAMKRIISKCIRTQCSHNMINAPRATRTTPRAVIHNAPATRKTAGATSNVREVAQDMMVTNFDCANDIAKHNKRVTVKAKDIELQQRILAKHGVCF